VDLFFIDSSLNQTKYHITYLLSNEISNFLDEIQVPLAVLKRVVFHQDGAMPHNARMNFVFLNHFGERRMDAHGAIRWPARSPDLNPSDFFIFIRNFRDNVYLTPSGTPKS
jgi:hypothetical protein